MKKSYIFLMLMFGGLLQASNAPVEPTISEGILLLALPCVARRYPGVGIEAIHMYRVPVSTEGLVTYDDMHRRLCEIFDVSYDETNVWGSELAGREGRFWPLGSTNNSGSVLSFNRGFSALPGMSCSIMQHYVDTHSLVDVRANARRILRWGLERASWAGAVIRATKL